MFIELTLCYTNWVTISRAFTVALCRCYWVVQMQESAVPSSNILS